MNLDINNDGKTNRVDGQIILAYTFAAVGIFLLVAAFWVNPVAIIDISIQSASGLLFSVCAAILGIDYHYSHLLQKTIATMQKKEEETE